MTEDQIKHMVDRFLCWRLPENFSPDAGISYTRPNYAASVDATPRGTNLFDAQQADAMVRYLLEELPQVNFPEFDHQGSTPLFSKEWCLGMANEEAKVGDPDCTMYTGA
jgi:hypothetical protein